MAFIPSKYQKTVYTYIKQGNGNAVIDAVAGSGKSTTIVNALQLIPSDKRVLFLAFNRDIVKELKAKIERLNLPNVEVSTLHSLGCRAMLRSFHSTVAEDKYTAELNDRIYRGVVKPNGELDESYMGEWRSNIRNLISLGRVNLVKTHRELNDLAWKYDLMLVDNEVEVAMNMIKWGESVKDCIDYTDMIYLPVVHNVRMTQYDWVFIDECQDLNAAQRNLFLKCVKPNGGRFIAVGDPRQAIYGFAGADVESFNLLKKLPHTVKLPLSVCYRCDSSILDVARPIVPHIEARPGADAGVVNNVAKLEEVKDGDMVLCRVTAPLVALCMRYISMNVKAYVKGRDIGANLKNMIAKTKASKMTEVMDKLGREGSKIIGKVIARQHCTEAEARQSSIYREYTDKVGAIEVLSSGIESASEVIDRIDKIFSDDTKEGICLSTVHKSKGLEADRVFIVCPDKFLLKFCMQVPWMAEQEYNLMYVAYTRAKHYLGFISDFTM